MISGDADGLRASEFSHAVECAHADRDLGRLRVGACPQASASERLEPIHRILGERTTVIAAALLPFPAAESGDRIDRMVAPCGTRHCRLPVNSAVARRDTGCRGVCRDRGTARLRVVSPIAAHGIKTFVGRNLIEQFCQDIAVSNVLMCHQRGPHLAGVRVERDMHLAPRAALRIAVLTDLPSAFAVDLHARAVDHQMNRVIDQCFPGGSTKYGGALCAWRPG